jgi:hypothetical protein
MLAAIRMHLARREHPIDMQKHLPAETVPVGLYELARSTLP